MFREGRVGRKHSDGRKHSGQPPVAGGGVGVGASGGSVGGAGVSAAVAGLGGRRSDRRDDEDGVDGVGDAIRAVLIEDDEVGTIDRLRRRVDLQHVAAERSQLRRREDLLLVELPGQHVGEHELLQGDLVGNDVVPHRQGLDRRVRRRQHGDPLGAEQVDHRLR